MYRRTKHRRHCWKNPDMVAEREKNMHFLDHLEELRWRIVKSLLGIVAGGAVTFAFIDPVLDVLIVPIKSMDAPWELQVLKVQGMFLIKWSIAFIGGIVLGLPIITYQFWQFVSPALRGKERNVAFPLILFTYLSFLIGIFFAYKILIPVSLTFFSSMGVSDIQNQFSIGACLLPGQDRPCYSCIHAPLPPSRNCFDYGYIRICYTAGSGKPVYDDSSTCGALRN